MKTISYTPIPKDEPEDGYPGMIVAAHIVHMRKRCFPGNTEAFTVIKMMNGDELLAEESIKTLEARLNRLED